MPFTTYCLRNYKKKKNYKLIMNKVKLRLLGKKLNFQYNIKIKVKQQQNKNSENKLINQCGHNKKLLLLSLYRE